MIEREKQRSDALQVKSSAQASSKQRLFCMVKLSFRAGADWVLCHEQSRVAESPDSPRSIRALTGAIAAE